MISVKSACFFWAAVDRTAERPLPPLVRRLATPLATGRGDGVGVGARRRRRKINNLRLAAGRCIQTNAFWSARGHFCGGSAYFRRPCARPVRIHGQEVFLRHQSSRPLAFVGVPRFCFEWPRRYRRRQLRRRPIVSLVWPLQRQSLRTQPWQRVGSTTASSRRRVFQRVFSVADRPSTTVSLPVVRAHWRRFPSVTRRNSLLDRLIPFHGTKVADSADVALALWPTGLLSFGGVSCIDRPLRRTPLVFFGAGSDPLLPFWACLAGDALMT